MISRWLIVASIACALSGAMASGCSTPPPPPVPSASAPIPVVEEQPPKIPPDPLMQQWNIFPNFVTGKIEVYHKGQYVGEITGDEPSNENPPLPHPPTDNGD